jgi:hypothetical protein
MGKGVGMEKFVAFLMYRTKFWILKLVFMYEILDPESGGYVH